jgi:hypothetical protein
MSKTTTRPQTKQQRRRDRREGQRRQETTRTSSGRKRLIIVSIIAVLLIAGTAFAINLLQSAGRASDNAAYPSIDGIACNTNEQLNYHIHAHLTMYINGQQFPLPASIGIASDNSCFYWLHTHDTTGIIHIETPGQQSYSLGTFFQEWSERFPQITYPTELDQTTGWQVYLNGKPYTGDFHSMPLTAHALITLAFNSPGIKPDTTYAWQSL